MISPDAYAQLQLPDQWLEDAMQEIESLWILEHTKQYSKVLELGWGSGIVARTLKDGGCHVLVVEGSRESCHIASEHHGIVSLQSMFEDFYTTQKYDLVIASFILEHIADPVALLKRARQWSDKLIVVVGNANSYHRQIAVKMGLQKELDSLSERDVTVGHVRVYDPQTIEFDLNDAGWQVVRRRGLGIKCLPNSMLAKLPPEVSKTMVQMEVNPEICANLFLTCEPRTYE